MLFWFIATAVTAIACAALYYASLGRRVNASADIGADDAVTGHHRQQLAEIEADLRIGRLSETEAVAAKAELAREVLRLQKEKRAAATSSVDGRVLPLAVLGVAALAFGTYSVLGNPDLPSQPLASRPEIAAQNMNLDDAITRIEARLAQAPDDLRGWSVIAPVYLQQGRYADAIKAYRRVNELGEPTPDTRTDLAEALMMANDGAADDEALGLLQQAADADASHVRSRFYLAGEAMRRGEYDEAVERWKALLDLATPEDNWRSAAEQGLAAAEQGISATAVAEADPDMQRELIQGMVGSLADRLGTDGGTIEEWTQLVRSYVVLGDTQKAQEAYDAARLAYPTLFDRADLDSFAASAGLELKESTP